MAGAAGTGDGVMTRATEARSIVDELIEERAPGLFGSVVGRRVMRSVLYPLLHYRDALELAEIVHDMSAREIFDFVSRTLALDVRAEGVPHVPADGAVLVAPNHPTGITDGFVVYDAIKTIRPDLCFFANKDALRVAPKLEEMIIPVEWSRDKKSHASARETLAAAARALKQGRCVVLFPAGRLAYLSWQGIRERPWQSTIVNLARRFDAPIVPMSISGRNSPLFYTFSQLSNELRDVTLFREFLNKRHYHYCVRIAAPIAAEAIEGDPNEFAADLQYLVEHAMPRHGPVARLQPRRRPHRPPS
jgi:putative hemolysin